MTRIMTSPWMRRLAILLLYASAVPLLHALPGALPVLNRHAVELAMRIGLALNCTVQPCTFARKNYFYPDMPTSYQIRQYEDPINVAGHLDLPDGSRVGIERAHLEQDAQGQTEYGVQDGDDQQCQQGDATTQ